MSTDPFALGRKIKQVQYQHHRTLDTVLADVGITLVQWDALKAIDRYPGASAHHLALETFQSDQSFGMLAGRLLGRGWIDRHPGHGKRLEHHLTPEGLKMLKAGQPIAAAALHASLNTLTESERATLLHLLSRIAAKPPDDLPTTK